MTECPTLQICTGCGNMWSAEQLAAEKAKNPRLLSCCPERRMVDIPHPPWFIEAADR